MKKQVLFVATLLFATQLTTAQVLYSENFDNLTLGNVGTDFTGATPGQGGWHTLSQALSVPADADSKYFRIILEPNKGKVLEFESLPSNGLNYIQKRNLDVLWNNRTSGNEIMKIEYDFYTGNNINTTNSQHNFCIRSDNNFDYISSSLGIFSYLQQQEVVNFGAFSNCKNITNGSTYLPENTWTRLIYYLDFKNQQIYFNVPSLNLIVKCNLASSSVAKSFFFLLRGSNISQYKFDNIVISAVNIVPLSTQDFISEKFNLYPNPAKNLVNITNTENIAIEKITVYDVNGKLIDTKILGKESNVTLDVSNYAAGTYLLHIETNEGIAVKKVVKK